MAFRVGQSAQATSSGKDVVLLHAMGSESASSFSAKVFTAFVRAVACCLLLAGSAWAFAACASNGDATLYAATSCAVAVALQALRLGERGAAAVRLAGIVAIVGAVVAVVASPLFRSGLFGFVNQIIARFDDAFSAYVPLLPLAEGVPGWPFLVLAGVLAAFAADALVCRRMAATTTVLVFVLGSVALWLGTGQPLPAFAAAGAGWLMVWLSASRGTGATLRGFVVTCCAAAVSLVVAVGLSSLYVPNPAVDQVRDNVVGTVHALRFGEDSLPEGNLADSPDMTDGDEERLVVTFDRLPSDEVHLRGFMGARFEEGAWKPLDHTAYEGSWTGLFDWLSAQGLDPAMQRAAFDDEDAAHGAEPVPTAKLSVEAVGANRSYVYAPSTLRSLEGAAKVAGRDGSLLAEGLWGAGSFSMEVEAVDPSADIVATPAWLLEGSRDGYEAAESVYRSFVSEHYLDLDETDRALVNELFYDDSTWSDDDPTPSAVISRVRVMLTTLASYTDHPAVAPAGERFLSWFLTEEREGNAAYFATAAVMAFRAQDLPARYVEGYRADAEELGKAAAEGAVTLTTQNAHAWVEVYLDGVGWAPVEVAPGYYDQPYEAGDVIEVNQGMAGGDASDAQQTGALGGDVDEEASTFGEVASALRVAVVALAVLAVFVALVCATIAVLEIRRAMLRGARTKRCASDDQGVAVPALYDELAALVCAAGVALESKRPLDSTAAVTVAFPGVAPEEYERVVGLVQKSVFGCKELREHEMRALRRFNVRLAAELDPARGMKEILVRRYRHLL